MHYTGSKFNTNKKVEEEGEGRGENIQLLLLCSGHIPAALLSHQRVWTCQHFDYAKFSSLGIYYSAILICFGDTHQSDSLSERKFVLLENIYEQLIHQLYFDLERSMQN